MRQYYLVMNNGSRVRCDMLGNEQMIVSSGDLNQPIILYHTKII